MNGKMYDVLQDFRFMRLLRLGVQPPTHDGFACYSCAEKIAHRMDFLKNGHGRIKMATVVYVYIFFFLLT